MRNGHERPDRARVLRRRILRVAALALAGVTLLAGCGTDRTRTVKVTIRHSRFDPALLHASPGETLRFVIHNLDPIDHELIFGDEEVQRRHENGTEAHHGTIPGEVSVPAGGTRSTAYTFDAPGTLPFGCHLPGHWAFGMRGAIRVA